ncbi:anion permease [Kocuria rhizophila]|nr:anion permease [Kocuria rhizophila]
MLFKPEMSKIPAARAECEELRELGPMSSGRARAPVVLAAAAWILGSILLDDPMISDAGIAVAVGLLLFLCPAGAAPGVRLLDWETAVKLPWGVCCCSAAA